MMKNKKGLMLKFIITIIIALAVFIPACGFVSKLFRLSDQARQSFESFVEEIEDLAENGEEGEERTFLLILDKGSYIAKFSGEDIVSDYHLGNQIWTVIFYLPTGCAERQCLVFCQEMEYIEDYYVHPNNYYHQRPIRCTDVKKAIILEDNLQIRSFIVAREITPNSDAVRVDEIYDEQFYHYQQVWSRRALMKLVKSQNEIYVWRDLKALEEEAGAEQIRWSYPEDGLSPEEEWAQYCLDYPDDERCNQ